MRQVSSRLFTYCSTNADFPELLAPKIVIFWILVSCTLSLISVVLQIIAWHLILQI
jgi:hypothetical protein